MLLIRSLLFIAFGGITVALAAALILLTFWAPSSVHWAITLGYCRLAVWAGRFFCPRCGSSIFARSADEIEVNLGSLDAPDQLVPNYELWTIRRESWLPPFPLTRRYERDRDATGRFEE